MKQETSEALGVKKRMLGKEASKRGGNKTIETRPRTAYWEEKEVKK